MLHLFIQMTNPAKILYTVSDTNKLQLTKPRSIDLIKADPVGSLAELNPLHAGALSILIDPFVNATPSSKILKLKSFFDKNAYLPTPSLFSSIPLSSIHPSFLSTHAEFLAKIYDHDTLFKTISAGSVPFDSPFTEPQQIWMLQTTLCNQRY